MIPATDADLGGGLSTSSMLLTGDLGVNGEEARPVAELAEPLCREAWDPSNKAKTSLASSSIMDSKDICCDMIMMLVGVFALGGGGGGGGRNKMFLFYYRAKKKKKKI